MKKLILLGLLLSLVGCDTPDGRLVTERKEDFNVYVIDSCEYIGRYTYSNSALLTHKGNCKFCIERNNKK